MIESKELLEEANEYFSNTGGFSENAEHISAHVQLDILTKAIIKYLLCILSFRKVEVAEQSLAALIKQVTRFSTFPEELSERLLHLEKIGKAFSEAASAGQDVVAVDDSVIDELLLVCYELKFYIMLETGFGLPKIHD